MAHDVDIALFPPDLTKVDGRAPLEERIMRPDEYGDVLESICGIADDSQEVEQYDGTLGVTQAFVNNRQSAVGQVQWNSNLASIYTNPGNVSGVRWGTGTLISSNLFLTAGHLFDQTGGGWERPRQNGTSNVISPQEIATNMKVNFNFQFDPAGNPRTEQSFAVTELVEFRLGSLDFAVVRLDGNPAATFGITRISSADAAIGDMIGIIGHPAGLRKRIEAGPVTNLVGTQILYNDIDTLGGNSGSGILRSLDERLVGVHTNGGCNPAGTGSNFGVRISSIINASPTVRSLVGPQLVVANFGQDAGGWRVDQHPRFLADTNGDGRADIVGFGNAGVYVSRAQANGTYSAPQLVVANFGRDAGGWRVDQHPRFLADTNGDGRADIVGFGNAGVYVSRAQANGTYSAPQLVVANFGRDAGGWRVDQHPRFLADTNGDGRADIVGFGNAGVYVSRAQANGTYSAPQLVVANFGRDAGGWRVDQHPRFLADTNGDGRADIVGFGNAGVYVSRAQANGTYSAPQLVVANFGRDAGGWRVDQHPRFLADTNGDGRADIVGFGNAGVYVSRAQANGTYSAPQLVVANFGRDAGGWRVDQHPRFLADTNGDGRADIVGFGNAGVYVSRAQANGTYSAPQLVVANFGRDAGGWRVDQHPRFLADTNGDGRADIVGFGNAGVYVSSSS